MKIRVAMLLCLSAAAAADEGMWTYNNFPAAKVKQKYGFAPTQEWLDHVRLSSARLAGGCSGSFVSPSGLVMTNHHCAHSCIEQLSTAQKDFVATGFLAKTEAEEIKCPEIEINQLTKISDVSDRVFKATAGLSGEKFNSARTAVMATIEKECSTGDAVRCEVVTLYRGGQYNLYQYKRFQDVRLVFAPEFATAFFGGDPDNFEFPRYDLDVSFLRVYEGEKPAKMGDYLKWNPAGVKEGDLTFVSGNPGGTSRLMTVAEMEFERDVNLPQRLLLLAEIRGMLQEFQNRGAEPKRHSTDLLFGVENSYKALKGRMESLLDKPFFAQKVAAEQALRKKVGKKSASNGAWDAIAKAEQTHAQIAKRLALVEGDAGRQLGPRSQAFMSQLFGYARELVRLADETTKPNEQRLREYSDGRMPAHRQALVSTAPVFDDLEIARLTLSLTHMRSVLGQDDPFVKKVLGKQSPAQVATALVSGSKLKDPAVRKKLLEGGKAAIAASTDSMIVMARQVDADSREIRKKYEDEIESVIDKNDALIAKAHFEAYGTSDYPDATFTLRLSYGSVKGFPESGKQVAPITQMGGAFDRATGQDPFALPQSWLAARTKIDATTPMNYCTTNDIIGGNSGSPVVNQAGEAVGLVFDGNIHSLGGEYGFDESVNRTVAVATNALTEALEKIYGAQRVANELRGSPSGSGAGSK